MVSVANSGDELILQPTKLESSKARIQVSFIQISVYSFGLRTHKQLIEKPLTVTPD